MSVSSIHEELAARYSYSREAPVVEREGYWVFEGQHRELGVEVTLKVLLRPPPDLPRYLKKLKDSRVENVVKVIELFDSPDALFLATERLPFGTLRQALVRPRKLDDSDAVFLCKAILGVHVDLLRAGVSWFGSEEDIEFAEGGLRLSWNNGVAFETANPLPAILSRIAGRLELPEQKILPFPKSKVLDDLIAISSLNASEIALSAVMKKREKLVKRRGKNWVGLREARNDFEYYEETVLLGVHREAGFVRVKSYPAGELDEELLALNRTKNTFTRLVESYNEGGRSWLVSEYSNDGSLASYVGRLKAGGVALREEQIEFFFYSLFEPLKLIQESPIRSLCMLHIKNIYIEGGIPKIGEPVPRTPDLLFQLREKADVPDFYHADFKRNPALKASTYDTYSLGVLLYKLMYTEYPIFPQKRVHIPTTPAYSQRLKTTLELFLNEGGMLKDLEKRIEVGEEVAKQVKLNKKQLLLQKEKSKRTVLRDADEEDIEKEPQAQEEEKTQGNGGEAGEGEGEEDEECCRLCCAQLEDPVKHRSVMLESLEESPYSSYRLCTKALLVLLLYVFLFYFFFLRAASTVLSATPFQRMNVTVSTVNYELTVSSPNSFYSAFNLTDRSLSALVGLGCFINNYGASGVDYTAAASSGGFTAYAVSGVLLMGVVLVLKVWSLVRFDLVRTLYNMSNLRANFNLTNYLLLNLFLCALTNCHFLVYHQLFKTALPTCLGVQHAYDFGSTRAYYSTPSAFAGVFVGLLGGLLVVAALQLAMVLRTERIRYTRLFNPIMVFLPWLVGYTLVARLGVAGSYFDPSLLHDIGTYGSYFLKADFVSILGTVPEVFFLLQFLLELLVDWLFWLTFDKRRTMLIHDISSAGILLH